MNLTVIRKDYPSTSERMLDDTIIVRDLAFPKSLFKNTYSED